MKSNRWVLLTFTAIACAGETGIAPPPAQLAAPPELQSPARIEATRQSLKQGEAGLQAYLNAVERGRPGYSVDPEALRRNRRDVADVRAALSLIRRNLDSLHGPSATVLLGDGTPVYADTTNMHWVDAGTWLKLYADVTGATFTASRSPRVSCRGRRDAAR